MKRNKVLRTAFSLSLALMPFLLTTVLFAAQEATPALEILPTDRTMLPIPESPLFYRTATPEPSFGSGA